MEAVRKRLPDWAFWLACVTPFLGFWTYGLFDLDEGFYGAVVVDMMRRHDWITPTLNGVPWFEKPILAYWLAIPSVQVFGEAVGPRLPSVLCTLATVVVLYRFALKHFNIAVARLTALVYSTNLLVVGIGRMMMTDAPLVLCLALTMTTLGDWRLARPADRVPLKESSAGWTEWILIGFLVGLGILAKGPVALILFGGVFLVASIGVPAFRGVWKSAWPVGLCVAAVVLATWYVPCYLANGQSFIQKFLIEQNIGRFAGGDRAHTVPIWAHPIYFPAVLLFSLLPWICFSGRSLFMKDRGEPESEVGSDSVSKFLWVWTSVPLVFFSISGTKLPHYILPAVAPLSVLVAATLVRVRKEWPWEQAALAWSVCVLVVAQYTYTSIWDGRMREVQVAAKYVRSKGGRLVVYKLGESKQPDAPLEMRETSHPSILYYLRGTAVLTDDPDAMGAVETPYFVLTGRQVADSDPKLKEASADRALQKGGHVFVERIPIEGLEKHALLRIDKNPIR